jgi:triacylglycerol esterase/lipase EstA (alpha/beta hydrolase family)
MSNAGIQRIIFVIQALAAAGIAWLLHKHVHLSWGRAIAIGVAAGFVVHALIIASGFTLSRIAASNTPVTHRIGLFGGLMCYLGELLASIRTFTFTQPWLVNRKIAGQRSKAKDCVPVLLLHGFMCNRALWRAMVRRLDAAGHATAAINLEPVFGSIDDYAPLIDHAVRRLQQRTGAAQVALVCHSMGGLAARTYLRSYGQTAIAKVVTLGTPHQGTFLAKFGHGKNARQMRQSSAWLSELANSEPLSRRRLFTVMFTHHDNIVAPQAVQTIDGAKMIEFSGMGHVAMVYNRNVQDAVVSELRQIQMQ